MALSIKYKAGAPLAAIAAITLALAVLASYSLIKLQSINDELASRFREIEEVREIEAHISRLIYPHQKYVAEFDKNAKAEADQSMAELTRSLNELNGMRVVNSEESELLGYVQDALPDIRKISGEIFSLPPGQSAHGILLLNSLSKKHLAPIGEKLGQWHAMEVNEVEELSAYSESSLKAFKLQAFLLLIALAAILAFSIWYHARTLTRPIMSITKATSELAAGNLKHRIDITSSDEIGLMAKNIQHMAHSLDKIYSDLEQEASTDPVTGLANRRLLSSVFIKETSRAKRHGETIAVVMLDIDHFKQVNDTYGHAIGDEVLKHIAGICKRMLREHDYCFRYGGEEFVLLIAANRSAELPQIVERLRKQIADTPWDKGTDRIAATASFGVSRYLNDGERLEQLLDAADSALYQAKRRGRNCIVAFGPDIPTTTAPDSVPTTTKAPA